MNTTGVIDRARVAPSIRFWPTTLALALLVGCASSTRPGAVGVGRPQLLTVAPSDVDAAAAGRYLRLSTEARQAGRLNSDPVLAARVQDIARRLIAEVGAFRPDAVSWAWEVNVFDADVLNAFCSPGGKIGVYSGLVRRLDLGDDEIATVLGHEIAHALREHSREQASQGELSDTIVQTLAALPVRSAGMASAATSLGSFVFVQQPFSRQMESEADLIGLELMARAGYDPRLASNVWRKLNAQDSSAGGLDFLRTHPTNDERIRQIEWAVSTVMAVRRPSREPLAPAQSVVPARAKVDAEPAKVKEVGQDEFQARRAAQAEACVDPVAVMVAKGPATEAYDVRCASGESRRYVCELGRCTAR